MRRVVVTGIGIISPVGLHIQEAWANTLAGRSGVGRISCLDPSPLDVQIAAEVKGFDATQLLGPKEAKRLPRFIQFAVAASDQALKDAQLNLEGNTDRYGCSIGVGIGAIQNIQETTHLIREKGHKWVSPFFIPFVIANMAAGITSNTFHLRGPNMCTTTACTSGTHAIGEAWLYIRNHMADVMVCGGAEGAISELTISGFANMKALSRNHADPERASRPFDRHRDGFVLGEGAGILVLEEFEHAKKRGAKIYAELAGYGMSGDAHHMTAPPPEGEGAQRCMRGALSSAQVLPEHVHYINAHGTSTPLNDVLESQAIERVFGEHAKALAVSSTKSVTGHCLGAAGGIEAVFLAKAIAEQTAPPTANLQEQDPECQLDYIPNIARPMKIGVGLSNSFGFGGTNACLLMKQLV